MPRRLSTFLIALIVLAKQPKCIPAFSILMLSSFDNGSTKPPAPQASYPSGPRGMLYGVPNSGWRSPEWNWGYGVGTGHDCAAICRSRYSDRQSRVQLIYQLLTSPSRNEESQRQPENFEEVKLVLALTWQRGRWDGTDGGVGGYGDVLSRMAEAELYEVGDPVHCARLLLHDMQSRFALLKPTQEDLLQMMLLDEDDDVFRAIRVCSGLVLQAMGFVERGL